MRYRDLDSEWSQTHNPPPPYVNWLLINKTYRSMKVLGFSIPTEWKIPRFRPANARWPKSQKPCPIPLLFFLFELPGWFTHFFKICFLDESVWNQPVVWKFSGLLFPSPWNLQLPLPPNYCPDQSCPCQGTYLLVHAQQRIILLLSKFLTLQCSPWCLLGRLGGTYVGHYVLFTKSPFT